MERGDLGRTIDTLAALILNKKALQTRSAFELYGCLKKLDSRIY
jgi:hypothetical protein